MGGISEAAFILKEADCLEGPFLDVGSKDYGGTQDYRPFFKDKGAYIGIDLEDGPGVDLVLDLTEDFNVVDKKLQGRRFGTVLCMSVMEHCEDPFKMARNITNLLKPKGRAYIAVPFSWRIHAYPNDYWRFTPEGVKKLFPDIEFDMVKSHALTRRDSFQSLDDDIGKISFSFGKHRRKGHMFRGVAAKLLKFLATCGILSWLAGYRYVMPPTGLLMVGTKKNIGLDIVKVD